MSRLRDRHLGLAGGAAACAVCCAAPVVGLLGVAGATAAALTLAFAGLAFALVVGGATVATVVARRARARRLSCAVAAPAGPVAVEVGPTKRRDADPARHQGS